MHYQDDKSGLVERYYSLLPSMDGQDPSLRTRYAELLHTFRQVEIAKEEWEQTMDCVSDMVVLTDTAGKIRRCNKSFKTFLGKTYEEIISQDCRDLLAARGMSLPESGCGSREVFFAPEDRWFIFDAYFVGDLSGNRIFGTVLTLHDVTELKAVTRQLELTHKETEENRQGLQLALDELSMLIQRVERDQTFEVRFNNPHLLQCHVAKNCGKTDCPCHGKEALRCWQIAGTHCGGKVQGAFAQKLENCVECDVFRTAAPDPIFAIGEHFNNMMHILEMKSTQLEQAYEQLKSTQAKIVHQEKMASIGQLAAGVAHEINNPMGFIASNLGTLGKYAARLREFIDIQQEALSGCDDEVKRRVEDSRGRLKLDYISDDMRQLIAESLDGADRVKTIVQNLKNFSRVDHAEARPADINECLETTINIAWNELKYKVTLKRDYGAIPRTKCHAQQLNQVFMNLLVNASHAIETRGEIAISTREENGSIYVTIADTGSGIPERNLTRIFEPFFTTKEAGKGTGLGLSITYDIVKKHNGDITVQSEVGKGATFTVRIPVLKED